jgi:hypothetical protein
MNIDHSNFRTLRGLKDTQEDDSTLLDRTMIILGSHMHSGSHDNRSLPIVLSGGGFRHGQRLAFDQDYTEPLASLCGTILQRLGLDSISFPRTPESCRA